MRCKSSLFLSSRRVVFLRLIPHSIFLLPLCLRALLDGIGLFFPRSLPNWCRGWILFPPGLQRSSWRPASAFARLPANQRFFLQDRPPRNGSDTPVVGYFELLRPIVY